ncbi:hypothetical protein [Romboutsia ilealis]|uniref:hypothetical protein n=1 Tax=Romboutsia ilealis TaxID=1115758 RepID=UPI0023F142ED|nr:hypothetical protein [Romboutsia ilealis]
MRILTKKIDEVCDFVRQGRMEGKLGIKVIEITDDLLIGFKHRETGRLHSYSIANKNLKEPENGKYIYLGYGGYSFIIYEKTIESVDLHRNLIQIRTGKYVITIEKLFEELKPKEGTRLVKFRLNDDYWNYQIGYFYKFTTISDCEKSYEGAVIEDMDGEVKVINLEEYKMEFADYLERKYQDQPNKEY